MNHEPQQDDRGITIVAVSFPPNQPKIGHVSDVLAPVSHSQGDADHKSFELMEHPCPFALLFKQLSARASDTLKVNRQP